MCLRNPTIKFRFQTEFFDNSKIPISLKFRFQLTLKLHKPEIRLPAELVTQHWLTLKVLTTLLIVLIDLFYFQSYGLD